MPPRRRERNVGPEPESVCARLYHELNEWSHLGPHEILEVHLETDYQGDHVMIDTDGPDVVVSCSVRHRDSEEDDADVFD